MICAEAQQKIQPWADGQLVAQETDSMGDHIADCARCAQQAESLQKNLTFIRDRLGRLAGLLPADLSFLEEIQATPAEIAPPPDLAGAEDPAGPRIPVLVPIAAIVLALVGVAWFFFFRDGEELTEEGDRVSVGRTEPRQPRSEEPGEEPPRENPVSEPPKEPVTPRPGPGPRVVSGSVSTLLPRLLQTPSQSTMNRLWSALGQNPADARRILGALELSEKEEERALLTLALGGASGERDVRSRLLDLLAADGSKLVRQAAAGALARVSNGSGRVPVMKGISVPTGSLTDADLRSRLLSAAESERDADVLATMIQALGPSQGEDPAIALRVDELLRSDDETIRKAAVGAMAGTKDSRRLVALIRDEKLPLEARAELVGYLSETHAPDLTRDLLDLLREATDDRIRLEVLGALAKRPEKSIVPELVRIIRSDAGADVRGAALGAITAKGGEELLPLLEEIAQNDPDQGLREAAKAAVKTIRQAGRDR